MSSCMAKLEFLPEPNMLIFRLGKLPLICYLFCIEFGQALLIPYERFLILLKSRSHTHHPHMHYSYTGSRRKNMHSIQIQQKCFTPTLGVNNKNILHKFPSINALSFCNYLSKDYCRKTHGLCKSYS
jgi:hypothetical protein